MDNQLAEKPRTVTLAVNLLWASLAIGFAKIPLDLPSLAAVPSPGIVWPLMILLLAFICFVIFKISSGGNWARITFLVLFLIGLIAAVPTLESEFSRAPIVGILSIVQGILQGYAMYLVFTSPGKTWFQKKAPAPSP